eukprot:7174088-Lingulodinium_polyedra.AAC.1
MFPEGRVERDSTNEERAARCLVLPKLSLAVFCAWSVFAGRAPWQFREVVAAASRQPGFQSQAPPPEH